MHRPLCFASAPWRARRFPPCSLGVCGPCRSRDGQWMHASFTSSSRPKTTMASPEKRGWAARCDRKGPPRAAPAPKPGSPSRQRRGGAGPERMWRSRSRAQLRAGLPATRAGLAESAAHPRLTGRGHRQRRRAPARRPRQGRATPVRQRQPTVTVRTRPGEIWGLVAKTTESL